MINFFEGKEGEKSFMRLIQYHLFWLLVLIDLIVVASPDFTLGYYFIILNVAWMLAMLIPKTLQKLIEIFPDIKK